ncbi:hypothetical protein CHARACLAT_015128 [Characodon lateralis]|uniref:Uncharacterized protein n=1 Tax=Characodon lateralis TaxID=208331 RepID=A0ABU7F5P0_9TELE|nr:hypothetical protein [Characodon lateralis]
MDSKLTPKLTASYQKTLSSSSARGKSLQTSKVLFMQNKLHCTHPSTPLAWLPKPYSEPVEPSLDGDFRQSKSVHLSEQRLGGCLSSVDEKTDRMEGLGLL